MSTPPDTDPASMPVSQALETTGIPQLDLVLGGGLPRGTLVIVLGPPGSGKTTLASQMAFATARRGQRALFLTAFSEPTTKLLEHLRGYRFFDPDLIGDTVHIFSLQQFLSQGANTMSQEIVAAVRQTRANLVVLDGFQAVRDLETHGEASRQLLYNLGTLLSLQGTTTLITTEVSPRDRAFFPEMTTADAIVGLYYELEGVRSFRGLEVLKVRGQAMLPGRHSLHLSEEGVQVFPRLETRVSRPTFEGLTATANQASPQERAVFELKELDDLLGGGLTPQTSTLLTGSPGTGKTLLGLRFALAGVSSGEPALLLSFRETGEQLFQKAAAFGLGERFRSALTASGGLLFQNWLPVEVDPDRVAHDLLTAAGTDGSAPGGHRQHPRTRTGCWGEQRARADPELSGRAAGCAANTRGDLVGHQRDAEDGDDRAGLFDRCSRGVGGKCAALAATGLSRSVAPRPFCSQDALFKPRVYVA